MLRRLRVDGAEELVEGRAAVTAGRGAAGTAVMQQGHTGTPETGTHICDGDGLGSREIRRPDEAGSHICDGAGVGSSEMRPPVPLRAHMGEALDSICSG